MVIALGVLIFLFLVLVFGGLYVFRTACVRRKEIPWLVREEIEKSSYRKYYDLITRSHNWLCDHTVQDVYIRSKDHLKLHALWVPAENARGTVLFAHGYRSTYLVDFGGAMDLYHRQGFNLLIPDQRAHGKSEGKYITFGVKESEDMLCWLQYHNETFGEYPVLLSGLSMGASTMMYVADQNLPCNVRGMIVDCGFTSPYAILDSVFRSVTHLPGWICLWATDIFAKLFADFRLKEKDSRKTLAKNRLPIIMVHGKTDDFVPCKMTEDGYGLCTGEKQQLLVENAGHGLSFLVDQQKYISTVNAFLEKYF